MVAQRAQQRGAELPVRHRASQSRLCVITAFWIRKEAAPARPPRVAYHPSPDVGGA